MRLTDAVAMAVPFAAAACLACGSSAMGATIAGDTAYVATVEVVQHDADAPAGFADTLRETMVRDAAFYGPADKPMTVRIELDRVHFKNAAAAMLIGDDNQTSGHVYVLDQATGEQLDSFTVRVDAEKSGDFVGEIALDVVGAFDPTGAVEIAHAAGDAASADINRSGTGGAMIANFAGETLLHIFGKARTRAAREDEQHAQSQTP